ncbi:MAG: aminotransferase class I/II-fold pyridoxal phosphate-dependent enzyme [Deltaproteobacteria bacterium]|nr:aminotransferase class I/II-fold pyridoxal phosphate-dependent enzyme [Candidatus Zymogenaceae bacterium]
MKVTLFSLERFYVDYEFNVGTNISASCGAETTTADLLALAGDEAKEHYLSLGLDYRENRGDERLRDLISREYDRLLADDIQVTAGGSEAIYLLMHTQLNPGDRIIVETPIYQSLFQVAEDMGVETARLPLAAEEGFVPDPNRLEKLLEEKRTKMVIVNHPHSPTGSVLTKQLLMELGALTEKHGALLVSDEVYWGVFYDPADRIPHAADLFENAVTIGDMTKPYGLGGLRVGWLASRRQDILDAASIMKDYTTMCASAPSEYLSILALEHRDEIIKKNTDIAQKNISRFDDLVTAVGGMLSWIPPRGGYTGFVRLDVPGRDVRGFCIDLIDKKDVLLLPGDVFGDSRRFRVGVGTREDVFVRGIACMAEYLQEL